MIWRSIGNTAEKNFLIFFRRNFIDDLLPFFFRQVPAAFCYNNNISPFITASHIAEVTCGKKKITCKKIRIFREKNIKSRLDSTVLEGIIEYDYFSLWPVVK